MNILSDIFGRLLSGNGPKIIITTFIPVVVAPSGHCYDHYYVWPNMSKDGSMFSLHEDDYGMGCDY